MRLRKGGKAGHRPRLARQSGEPVQIYGLHAAEAALANMRRQILRVAATPNAAARLAPALERRGLAADIVSPRDLDHVLGGDAVHQGALIEAGPLPLLDVEDLADARLVVALDQISDPQNVGAIFRSAAAFGADAVVMTAHHSPPLSGALAKAASGGLDSVGVVLAANLARALSQLGEMGFSRVGLDSEASEPLAASSFTERTVLVLGAEGKGLRRLTRENCDALCAIGTAGGLASLNVSNAAAIALHLSFEARRSAKAG